MRRAAALTVALVLAAAGTALAANDLTEVPDVSQVPRGYHLSGTKAIAIAGAVPKVRAAVHGRRGVYPAAYRKSAHRWQISWFDAAGHELAQVVVDDAGQRVVEAWTGFQVAWEMARGYPGAFGRRSEALYVWLPMCLLFIAPFFDRRRPLRMLHFDLAALLAFSVSLAYFSNAHLYASVPLAYPPLIYLLVRMLWIGWRRSAPTPPLRLVVPASWLVVGIVFLVGFRGALNVTDSNVIDVGYAGVIGADHLVTGQPLYGHFPSDIQQGDTYGPAAYAAYVPFLELFGFHRRWDDLPAAHGASVIFDLLCIGLLFMLGRRIRGPTLGLALAYAWAAYPFTLFTLESNTNDALAGALLLAALLVAGSPAKRGAMAALAGLTKFAPLAVAPLLATHGLSEESSRLRKARVVGVFALSFAAATAAALAPVVIHGSLRTMWDRTIVYQAGRGSPFSVWGLYGHLGWAQTTVQVAAAALAIAVAVLPRRRDLIGLAALAAAVVIAAQLGVTHWFYLYIPWFVGLALVALLGRHEDLLDRVGAQRA